MFCQTCGTEVAAPPDPQLSTARAFWTLIAALTPVLNPVLLLVWAFSGSTNPSQRSLARAALLYLAIVAVVSIGLYLLMALPQH